MISMIKLFVRVPKFANWNLKIAFKLRLLFIMVHWDIKNWQFDGLNQLIERSKPTKKEFQIRISKHRNKLILNHPQS